MMMKKLLSLLLALAMCMTLCVPAFAAEGVQPRMRNSDYRSTPVLGTSASEYTSYLGARYGNIQNEEVICDAATGVVSAWLTGGFAGLFGSANAQLIAGVVGSGVLSATGITIQSLAMQYAPNSKVIGYVMHTYAYPSPFPTEQYYKYVVVYYPTAVSSDQPLPGAGTSNTFYEYNWFS